MGFQFRHQNKRKLIKTKLNLQILNQSCQSQDKMLRGQKYRPEKENSWHEVHLSQ